VRSIEDRIEAVADSVTVNWLCITVCSPDMVEGKWNPVPSKA
jgi:hypothetical protein